MNSVQIKELIKNLWWHANQPGPIKAQRIAYIKNQVNKLCKENNYTHTGCYLQPHKGMFHRAIKYIDKPMHVNNLGCPPSHLASLSRANFENKPVFYCSGDPKATLFELGIKEGDNIVLSKWTLLEEIPFLPIGYDMLSFQRLKAERECPIITSEIEMHPNENKENNKKIKRFFNEIFTDKNPNVYCITASIAEWHFKAEPSMKPRILAYPAVGMHGNAENFVFTSDQVEKNLSLISVKWYRVKRAFISDSEAEFELLPLDYANSVSDNQINWQGMLPEEERGLNIL